MNAAEAVMLKPSDQRYDVLWHDLGVFAIELSSVTPAPNGSRVTLRVENLRAHDRLGVVTAAGRPTEPVSITQQAEAAP